MGNFSCSGKRNGKNREKFRLQTQVISGKPLYWQRGWSSQPTVFWKSTTWLVDETPRLTGTRWGNLSFVCPCRNGIVGKKNWLMLSSQTLAQPSNTIYICSGVFCCFFFSDPWNIHGSTDRELHLWHVYHTNAWKRCLSRPGVNKDAEEAKRAHLASSVQFLFQL